MKKDNQMKKKHVFKLLAFFMAVTVVGGFCACQSDGIPDVTADAATRQWLDKGSVSLDWTATAVHMVLNGENARWQVSLQDGGEEDASDWCRIRQEATETGTDVEVSVVENIGMASRRSVVTLVCGDYRKTVEIVQRGKPQIQLDAAHVDVKGTGGDVLVVLHTNVANAIDSATMPSWLHLKAVERNVGDGGEQAGMAVMLYQFTADANAGLGRAHDVTFRDGKGLAVKATVHQWPGELHEEESIHVDQPGQLGVLLGGDVSGWASIRRLCLSGQLDNTDMQALRLLLGEAAGYRLQQVAYDKERHTIHRATLVSEVTLGVEHLDMGQCTLVAGGDDYAEPTVVTSRQSAYRAFADHTLGDAAFNILRMPLKSIVLPEGLQTIGDHAFYYSYHLVSIQLPASVKQIGGSAFMNCQKLTSIHIPSNSQLQHIGDNAFATSSNIDELRLPASLVIDNSRPSPFGMAHTRNIHVSWPVPPSLGRMRVKRALTLYVPRGSGEAYRAAAGWSNAETIIEE